jgi:uncharacterized protein (TIGR00369 family)
MDETNAADRTRMVSWEDPQVTFRAWREMGGLSYLQVLIRDELPRPPFGILLGFSLIEADEGWAVFSVEPAEYHYNPLGSAHGGLASALLDSALGCAIQTMLPAGATYTTAQSNVNFVRPLTVETGPVRCEAKALHVGRKLATAEGQLIDADGKLYAHGSTTCVVFPAAGDHRNDRKGQ